MLGNDDGTFGPARTDATPGLDARAIVTTDFNLDGELDFAVVNVLLSKDVLWPPNHKLMDVTVDYTTTNMRPGDVHVERDQQRAGKRQW